MMGIIEKFGPISLAALSCLLLYYFRSDLIQLSVSEDINVSNIYSSVFDWSSIQTGFLFAIFGFIAGKTDGFINRIKDTPEMKIFLKYTKHALLLGFAITFASIPMTVTSFDIAKGASWKFHFFAAWSFLSVWGFFSFLRVAYIFGAIIKVKDDKRVVG
ncbi:hypothetical protein [Rhizobium sp. RU20A]|uniref:hypothetical protein n=1 Tax=Rhizobium sp. RU20A TaxID=1907412 RepID=UPI00122C81B8|nr:hypothetical protein [Rhizobium sp. RU20A]